MRGGGHKRGGNYFGLMRELKTYIYMYLKPIPFHLVSAEVGGEGGKGKGGGEVDNLKAFFFSPRFWEVAVVVDERSVCVGGLFTTTCVSLSYIWTIFFFLFFSSFLQLNCFFFVFLLLYYIHICTWVRAFSRTYGLHSPQLRLCY